MICKRIGRFEVQAFTDGWPIQVCIRDLSSSSNPCEQVALRITLEDARDLLYALIRVITMAKTKEVQ